MVDIKTRTWCMTLNNYTEDELDFATNKWAAMCTRWIAAKEVGENGTPHLQCYMTLRRPNRLAWLKKRWPRSHFSVAKASEEENWVYCLKPDENGKVNVVIDFTSKMQGARNDITDFCEAMKERGIKRTALDDPSVYVKYHKGLEKWEHIYKMSLISHKTEHTDFNRPFLDLPDEGCFYIFWGSSQIGKTDFALAHFNEPLLVTQIEDLRDYDQTRHDGIVFDDMDFNHIPRTACIHLTDRAKWRSIYMRYINWVKPPHLKVIATTNNYEGRIFGEHSDDEAVVNRIQVFNMGTEKLY